MRSILIHGAWPRGPKLSAVALAVAVHLAADRGLLGYDDPVAKSWAKFGAAGKEGASACVRRDMVEVAVAER